MDDRYDDKKVRVFFSKKLRELRESQGFTRKDFAAAVGVSSDVIIANYENLNHEPNFGTLMNMARVLDVSLDELLGYEPFSALVYNTKFRLAMANEFLANLGYKVTKHKGGVYGVALKDSTPAFVGGKVIMTTAEAVYFADDSTFLTYVEKLMTLAQESDTAKKIVDSAINALIAAKIGSDKNAD